MLSNINVDKNQLLQMVLVGQPQLRELLCRPDLQQFAQRVAADFNIPPFSADEVEDYVQHRLSVAGREARLFDDAALSLIADASGGIPRAINILCDMALVYGFSRQADPVPSEIVEEMLQDKLEHGVFGLSAPGPTGPEPVAEERDTAQSPPARKRLIELPEAGSQRLFDSKALREVLTVTSKKS